MVCVSDFLEWPHSRALGCSVGPFRFSHRAFINIDRDQGESEGTIMGRTARGSTQRAVQYLL